MTSDQKIDKIFDAITDLKVQMAEHVAYTKSYQSSSDKKLTEHEAKIIVLEAHRNEGKGRRTVQTIGISALISACTAWIVKHF